MTAFDYTYVRDNRFIDTAIALFWLDLNGELDWVGRGICSDPLCTRANAAS